MRKLFLSLLCFFIATTYLNAQTQNSNEQTKIHQTVTHFFDCFSTLDTTIIQKYVTNDFILLEDGIVWNMDTIAVHFIQIKDRLKGGSLTRINHLDFIQTEVNGNSGWVAYNNTADITYNNAQNRKLHWLESAFLVKEGKDWKIRLLHSTVVKSKTP